MLVLFYLASFDQSEEYLLAFAQVELLACRYLNADDAVEFSEECPLHHYRCPVDLMFIKVNSSFILIISWLVGWV